MVVYEGDDEDMKNAVECAGIIASTIRGTMPYMRNLGIRYAVSQNAINATACIESEMISQIEEWEDRVKVKNITYSNKDNKLIPKVVVDKNVEDD